MSSGNMVASLIRRYEAENEKNQTKSHTASPNKIDNTKVTDTSPKSVISKSSSCISSDSSDIESSSLGDQLSSDLCLSREGSSLSKSDESSNEKLTLVDNNLCFFHNNNVDIWVSSFDLDEEDSELIEEEQDIGSFDANFPSPSFNARSECENYCKEELDKLVFNSDTEEPIFWPFENESYKTPDLNKFLCVSPRRNILDMDRAVKSGLDPIRVRFHQKSNWFKGTSGCERKIVPNPEPNLICTATRTQQILNTPSRLGRLSNVPNDLKYENLFPTKGATVRNLIKPWKNLIRGGGLRTLKESSIEKSMGLHEFDGHEGIEEHGADNEIPLCGSPWQITSMMKLDMQRIKRGPVRRILSS